MIKLFLLEGGQNPYKFKITHATDGCCMGDFVGTVHNFV